MTAQVTTSATGRVAVLALCGEHDLATAEELRRTLVELCAQASLIVVDLEKATFVDCSVIGLLVGGWKRARSQGHQVVAIRAQGPVRKALHVTGVDALLELAPRTHPMLTTLEQELEQLLSG